MPLPVTPCGAFVQSSAPRPVLSPRHTPAPRPTAKNTPRHPTCPRRPFRAQNQLCCPEVRGHNALGAAAAALPQARIRPPPPPPGGVGGSVTRSWGLSNGGKGGVGVVSGGPTGCSMYFGSFRGCLCGGSSLPTSRAPQWHKAQGPWPAPVFRESFSRLCPGAVAVSCQRSLPHNISDQS